MALLFCVAACEKKPNPDPTPVDPEEPTPTETTLQTVSVKVENFNTKFSLTESTSAVTPSFSVDDVIIGFTGTTSYAYKCTKASTETAPAEFTAASATLPSADKGTKINLFYIPGYEASAIVDGALSVDLSAQNAATTATVPVVLAGQGTVDANGACEVTLKNQMTIINLTDAVISGVAEGTAITSLKATGLYGKIDFAASSQLSATVDPAVSEIVINNVPALGAGSKFSSSFVAFPAAPSDVVFTATTADGKEYTYTEKGLVFNASENIKLSNKTFTSASDIPDVYTEVSVSNYAEFSEAVKAAQTADANYEIKLTGDVEITDDSINITNEKGKKISIDINGHILSSPCTMVLQADGILNVTDKSAGHTGKIQAMQPGFFKALSNGVISITDCYLETTCIDASLASTNGMVIVEGDDNKISTVNITNCTMKAVGESGVTLIGAKSGNLNIENSTLINSFGTEGGGYYCILTASGNKVKISNSNIISECRNVIITGSNTYYDITNSYFYSKTGDAFQRSSNTTRDQYITIHSGWFSTDIRTSMPNWVLVDGTEWAPIPPVTKTIDGVDYQFGFTVRNK